MEEIFIKDDSWFISKEIRDAHLRDVLQVSIIGITEENGKFIQMPKSNTIVHKGSKLLVVGKQKDISIAKRLVNKKEKPKDLNNV